MKVLKSLKIDHLIIESVEFKEEFILKIKIYIYIYVYLDFIR